MSRWNWLVCAVSLVLLGCGEGSSGVATVSVTGVVTLNGQPLPGAAVSFSPKGGKGRAAVGATDIDGKFTLTTVTAGDGAVPGEYGVSVTKNAAAAAQPTSDPRSTGGAMSAEDTAKMMASLQKGKTVEQQSDLPAKYASPDSSGLQAEVTSGGSNNFKFELTK